MFASSRHPAQVPALCHKDVRRHVHLHHALLSCVQVSAASVHGALFHSNNPCKQITYLDALLPVLSRHEHVSCGPCENGIACCALAIKLKPVLSGAECYVYCLSAVTATRVKSFIHVASQWTRRGFTHHHSPLRFSLVLPLQCLLTAKLAFTSCCCVFRGCWCRWQASAIQV